MAENIYLKNITGGKLHRSSLVFHFECDNQNHEFQIKRFNSKSVNLTPMCPSEKRNPLVPQRPRKGLSWKYDFSDSVNGIRIVWCSGCVSVTYWLFSSGDNPHLDLSALYQHLIGRDQNILSSIQINLIKRNWHIFFCIK